MSHVSMYTTVIMVPLPKGHVSDDNVDGASPYG